MLWALRGTTKWALALVVCERSRLLAPWKATYSTKTNLAITSVLSNSSIMASGGHLKVKDAMNLNGSLGVPPEKSPKPKKNRFWSGLKLLGSSEKELSAKKNGDFQQLKEQNGSTPANLNNGQMAKNMGTNSVSPVGVRRNKSFGGSPFKFILPKIKSQKKQLAKKVKRAGSLKLGKDGAVTLDNGVEKEVSVEKPVVAFEDVGGAYGKKIPPYTVTITVKAPEGPDDKPSLIAQIQPDTWLAPEKPRSFQPTQPVALKPVDLPPVPVYETQYVSTTFKARKAGISCVTDDVLMELYDWSKDHFLICAEILYSTPERFGQETKKELLMAESMASHMTELKSSLCHVVGINIVPEATVENVYTRGDKANLLGLHRFYTTPLLEKFAHKETRVRHSNAWKFRPGEANWDDILRKYTQKKLQYTTIVNLNLVCLKLKQPVILEREDVEQKADGKPALPAPADKTGDLIYKLKQNLSLSKIEPAPRPITIKQIPKGLNVQVVADIPKIPVVHKKVVVSLPLVPKKKPFPIRFASKALETRFISTTFEVHNSQSLKSAFENELVQELKRWITEDFIVCCEVLWSTPATHRDPALEHEMTETIRRQLVPVKFNLAALLSLGSVPRSQCQESTKNHNDLYWTGAFRYFTPRLMEYAHEEGATKHNPFWGFQPESPPWESLWADYPMKFLHTNSVVKINFVCLKFM